MDSESENNGDVRRGEEDLLYREEDSEAPIDDDIPVPVVFLEGKNGQVLADVAEEHAEELGVKSVASALRGRKVDDGDSSTSSSSSGAPILSSHLLLKRARRSGSVSDGDAEVDKEDEPVAKRRAPQGRYFLPPVAQECFNCGSSEHFARDCPNPRTKHRTDVACHVCGEMGHVKANCPKQSCKYCRQVGHGMADCPRLKCNRCGKGGHHRKDCTEPAIYCYNCGEEGHAGGGCLRPTMDELIARRMADRRDRRDHREYDSDGDGGFPRGRSDQRNQWGNQNRGGRGGSRRSDTPVGAYDRSEFWGGKRGNGRGGEQRGRPAWSRGRGGGRSPAPRSESAPPYMRRGRGR